MTYPSSQTVDHNLTFACPTTHHAAIIMAKRDAVGVAKYGQTVDQNPLSASEWAQHAIEEAADGLKYAIRAREEALRLEREVQALREKVRRLEDIGDKMAIYAQLGGVPLKFVGVVNAWREAKG